VLTPGQVLTPAVGIHLIPIDMPSPSSPVNVYLVEDEPLTLVDTGPNLPATVVQLERALGQLGHAVEDLERIVLTHPHIDHMGVAGVLRDRSGAEIWAPAGSEAWLGDYQNHGRWLKSWRDSLMLLHGVSPEVVEASTHGTSFLTGWDPSVRVDQTVKDGDVVPFANREWAVMFRPGHSPVDMLLGDIPRGEFLVGDHLIEHISSNALITPAEGQAITDRPLTLMIYRRSLQRTAELSIKLSLAGHGSPIIDHRALIEHRLRSMDRRTFRIHQLIAESPRTAHEIAREIWGERSENQAFLTISETLGHVDRLVCSGYVREIPDDDTRVHFECVAAPEIDDLEHVAPVYM
jgi:glyoxylase-like metal-dependent hydrolase (beta-lactamase superfamily II)